MSALEALLARLGGGDNLTQISRQLGTDERTTQTAMSAALPTILAALSRNASKPEGAESLNGALARDHDGSVLDDITGFLKRGETRDGSGILEHVLGSRRQTVQGGVSKASGMDRESTSKLMEMLAPLVMGALGKEKRENGLDPNGLSSFLNRKEAEVRREAPHEMSLAGKLLDADKDGDVDLSDWIKHGSGLVGKLFSKG